MPIHVDPKLIGAGLSFGTALGLLWLYFSQNHTDSEETDSSNQINQDSHRTTSAAIPIKDVATLIQELNLEESINSIRVRCALTKENFDRDCMPLIHAAIDYAQLLPASESHHHAQPGGLIIHMLETVQHAVQIRNGYMLPKNAAPEEVTEMQHRWTYGIIVAALLHDIARPMSDINVYLFADGIKRRRWQPVTGSMRASGATHYAIDFDIEERNYLAHQKLPVMLMQALVPASSMRWLSDDERLIEDLTEYLSGIKDNKPIPEIVTKADSESVKRNLLTGSRVRFTVAKRAPLIELLMQAIRDMHRDGQIVINRPGACGWVYGDSIWYVSKRLADEVRAYLQQNKVQGIPGTEKNDRLFDTWQEYGALITTPTGKAVWDVMISMPDWEGKRMTVLRFPLEKIYGKDIGTYPSPMHGRIDVIEQQEAAPSTATNEKQADVISEANQNTLEHPMIEAKSNIDVSLPDSAPESGSTKASIDDKKFEANSLPDEDIAAASNRSETPAVEVDENNSGLLPSWLTVSEESEPQAIAVAKTQAKPVPVVEAPPSKQDFLPADDSAFHSIKQDLQARKSRLEAKTLAPVAPKPKTAAVKPKKSENEPALRFINWVQQGIATGSIDYNDKNTPIHFVEEGMMLVSPAIFILFSKLNGEDGLGSPSNGSPGVEIQRSVLKCGWHMRVFSEDGSKKNIAKYRVTNKNRDESMLNGIVIVDPIRWINPLPKKNPHLKLTNQPVVDEKKLLSEAIS